MEKKALITGVNGIMGSGLFKQLIFQRYQLQFTVRRSKKQDDFACVFVGKIAPETNWAKAFKGVDVLLYLAARVHVIKVVAKNSLDEFRKLNVKGNRRLANMAVDAVL